MGGNSGSPDLADNGLGDGRPPIPTRPEDEREDGESEESGDEKPQVVVLREGKHLSEVEVENEKRKGETLRFFATAGRLGFPLHAVVEVPGVGYVVGGRV